MKNVFSFTSLNPGLAYLIGVYLGDGFVDKIRTSRSGAEPSYYFKLGSVDRDFVEQVRLAYAVVVTPNPPKIRETLEKDDRVVYRFSVGSADFCRWLLEICEVKDIIPSLIPRESSFLTKAFLEGIMDSEGYVSYQEKNHWLMCGFAVSSVWAHEVAELFRLQDVGVGKCTFYKSKRGTQMYSYRVNIKSFYAAGMRFHLQRKHSKVLHYLSPPETTTRTTLAG